MREHRATAEPRGFGSRSVAIDLAKCTGSDCGITDTEGRETARQRGTHREEQRGDMTDTKAVFIGSHVD